MKYEKQKKKDPYKEGKSKDVELKINTKDDIQLK